MIKIVLMNLILRENSMPFGTIWIPEIFYKETSEQQELDQEEEVCHSEQSQEQSPQG